MNALQEGLGDVKYKFLLERLKELRPIIPQWDGKSDNADDWKHKSAMQEGFDLALTTFGLKIGD